MRIPDSSAAATFAYEEIKRRIIDLEYPPGTKLSEAPLAEELGFGRSPIRTAFARLQGEGWVTISPQSGTYVRRPTEAEIAEIYDLRFLLETHATRQAARNISADQLDDLRREFRRRMPQQGEKMNERMFDDINELDAMFHAAVYRAAGNSLITGILLNLFDKVTWLKKASPSSAARMKQWGAELRGVLNALEKRDPDAAARRMRAHIGHAAESGTEYRRTHPAPAEKKTTRSKPSVATSQPASRVDRKAAR
jgi:DNA-binding GntR family transcriptional regulator